MSNVKVADLSPVPFFARFLEGQFSKDLTQEEMRSMRGGSAVTMAYPSDSDAAEIRPPVEQWPGLEELIRRATAGLGQLPSLPGLLTPHPTGPGPFPVEPGGGAGGA
jgi:hypothetical protein